MTGVDQIRVLEAVDLGQLLPVGTVTLGNVAEGVAGLNSHAAGLVAAAVDVGAARSPAEVAVAVLDDLVQADAGGLVGAIKTAALAVQHELAVGVQADILGGTAEVAAMANTVIARLVAVVVLLLLLWLRSASPVLLLSSASVLLVPALAVLVISPPSVVILPPSLLVLLSLPLLLLLAADPVLFLLLLLLLLFVLLVLPVLNTVLQLVTGNCTSNSAEDGAQLAVAGLAANLVSTETTGDTTTNGAEEATLLLIAILLVAALVVLLGLLGSSGVVRGSFSLDIAALVVVVVVVVAHGEGFW